MFQNFRLSMAWLHTWFGLVLGFVLFVIFFFGSMSVFDREIDRWAIPETRFEPRPMPSFDQVLRPQFEQLKLSGPERQMAEAMSRTPLPSAMPVHEWGVYATHRDPVLVAWAGFELADPKVVGQDHVFTLASLDSRDGRPLPGDRLRIGSDFFYPMHYNLHLSWRDLGYWVVGLAALVMLAALVSGVVMHRKIFREFFTFRPRKSTQRSALDLHNLTGVVALPFHFFFALSGLIIFARIYLPVDALVLPEAAQAGEAKMLAELGLPEQAAGVPAGLASVDAMVAEARRRWAERGEAGEVGMLTIHHVGDANAVVSVYRAGTDRMALTSDGIHFSGPTGELIREDPPVTAVAGVNEFLMGLHLQHFRHWPLRWLYVLGGLAGCVCIATGFIFFVEKRKKQHAKTGSRAIRWVDALAVATVLGTLVATASMLVANRVLPADLPMRGVWEQRVFWGAWCVSLLHALLRSGPVASARPSPAWGEQCRGLAVLCVLAVLSNWVTTGDHLLRTIGRYWPVAGFDLALLVTAGIAMLAARHPGLRMAAGLPRGGRHA